MEQLMRFFVLSEHAAQQGATPSRAREIGLIGGILPGFMGFMVGLIAARNVAPPPAAPAEPVRDTPTRRTAPVA